MRERLLFERRLGVALLAMLIVSCTGPDGSPLELGESLAPYDAGTPCPDADGDGQCDEDDPTCNADGSVLTCRRVAPSCPRGTVPEVREGCYTDRCVTWAECADCEARPTVPADDPLYDRFEGTGFANRCATDADCVVGGCSGEVCAAESVATTCELLPYGPEGGCGCVDGQCVWHVDSCSGGACTPIRDGELGFCDAVLGWGVLESTGRCGVVSGCGCTEPTCGGRVFGTQRECEAACGGGCRIDADCAAGQVCSDGVCETPACVAVPTVARDDRYYERFEGTEAANRCTTSSDCVRSGCSGEVCAAESVATTCELLPYGPSGDCGCVDGVCIWHRMDCWGSERLCAPVRPGEFGLCRMTMGWGVSAETGACVPISGCGCGEDPSCGGRIFETEAACRRACAPSACWRDADGDGICDSEDTLCNSDGIDLACRRVEPPCPRGTVPEVREGCYTDRCVSWTECARISGT